MSWLLKEISIFLSLFLLVSCSFQSNEAVEKEIDKTILLYPEFIDNVLSFQQEKHENIDSLGFKISKINDSLQFYPYKNNIENNTFIFTAPKTENFQPFLKLDVFKGSLTAKDKVYQVWRLSNNSGRVEVSIEPHPTEKWVLVFRKT